MEPMVRHYISKDFDPVCLLELGIKGSPYAAAVFVRQAAELFPDTFLVLLEDGMVRGFAVGAIVPANPREAWIIRMRIADNCQGRGLGRMLSSDLIAAIQKKGVNKIFLTVSPANIPAVRLYASVGFFETAFKPDYFGPGEDRLIMLHTL
jgi:ribosomal-protein-alanine N-acetyltransferase